ncbi:XRE family transcriptional regulator [Actinobacteria bacterium YIM 96077]|uniref:XRE family transcriptional regulator n=1 Tax=Phytoactinopolyspora halophila TaxID=1981511 RepID=A0A329QZH1_9ACTN|nr:helix-turn-helix transcriptional regulator [Phytoactinopolyspora halophila]AYY13142.1 XRE family transcriptional regulator [Actinobacteria bacterium YIM 96077]RAW17617.1 XRE family transcriptional regulator [Phytoactinopolyspora halophila]
MGQDTERRRELGDFLRKRRAELVRADFQLPPVGRTRVTGLRREEIAYRAGVSVTWYTWLEQGREINPSRQVLDSIARNMRLSVAEHEYVLSLAGYAPNHSTELAPVAAPAHLQRLLDAQGDAPAFAVSPDWTIAAWNAAYEALYPNVATVAPEQRNLLWLIFTDPYVRQMLPDWEVTSRHFVAEYRAEAGPSLGHPAHVTLVGRLLDESPEFARAWEEHRIERFASRERRFHHPDVGDLLFEHHRLIPSDVPDVHVVVYVPQPDSATRTRMRTLTRP